jgi:hypothetical protein
MKNASPRSLLLAAALAVPLIQAIPGLALAQETPPPPPPATTPEPVRMAPGAGLGIGAIVFLSGTGGAEVVYDLAKFHIEGLFGFNHHDRNGANADYTDYTFGARGWYHLHTGSNSDFSLGGGLGVVTASGTGSATATFIEPGALARVFLTPNFALHGSVGFRLVFGDQVLGDVDIGLGGQVTSSFGFTYFFR